MSASRFNIFRSSNMSDLGGIGRLIGGVIGGPIGGFIVGQIADTIGNKAQGAGITYGADGTNAGVMGLGNVDTASSLVKGAGKAGIGY
jgi:hypothetical protein